jgi:ATP-dependent helicase HrpA
LTQTIKPLYQQISKCYGADRHRLRQALRRLEKKLAEKKADDAEIEKLTQRITDSVHYRERRLQALPKPEYPDLPVSDRRDEIINALSENQVVVICGETGSGKTTQLPKMCLDLGRGVDGMIAHTQPRRLAARSVANRIAEELKSDLGQQVGYKVRFQDKVSKDSYIKLMTDGILLAEIQEDRYLNRYDTIIVDEAHERSLNIDFLLGYLKWLLPRRKDLKLIITSATIDTERFSRHFNNAPIIEVSGRTYPVDIRYRPILGEEEDKDIPQGILDAVDELFLEQRGDVLVFLPGEREIRETADFLSKQIGNSVDVLPLYARLSATEQNRIFHPGGKTRIVLSTNVAETSLTVPGIKYVIDPGTARISRYSWRSRVQRLQIEKISQASANQRSGRCGRVSSGIAIRLYDEEDFENRPEFTDPEILRTNLASVILQMSALRLGDPEDFPFVEAPDKRMIRDGFKLLFELGGVNDNHRITKIGQQLSRLPIDPRLARMLIEAERNGALREVSIIVSALSIQDPRERPMDKQQASDEKHNRFKDTDSDFLSILKLWEYYQEKQAELSQNQFRKLCKKEFLSFMRLREWRDIYQQIQTTLKELKCKENQQESGYDAIHQSLLTGLLSSLGTLDENKEYLGVHNRRFFIFPGSGVYKKAPKWVMAASMVETTKLYARTVAKIQPEWIEKAADHLLVHHYSEPHWQKKPAQVGAFERLSLYGLTVNPKRRVNFGPLDPKTSREIFIRHALVYGDYQTKADFFRHNRQLIEDIETLEAKSRRRDILIDEDRLYDFYDEKLPDHIHSGHAFEKWRKKAESNQPKQLYVTRDFLMQRDDEHVTEDQYPDYMTVQEARLPLSYHFEPNHVRDGVSVKIPAVLLNQMQNQDFDDLVPGMLEEKVTAIIRALPKTIRKQFVPAPEYAKRCVEKMQQEESTSERPLAERVAHTLFRITGNQIPADALESLDISDHHRMRYEVVDEKGNVLQTGRDLEVLRKQVKQTTRKAMDVLPTHSLEQSNMTDWACQDLPDHVTLESHGLTVKSWVGLQDDKDTVSVHLFDQASKAEKSHQQGLLRLFNLQCTDEMRHLRKNLPNIQQLCLYYNGTGQCKELTESIIQNAIRLTFLNNNHAIRTQTTFQKALTNKPRLTEQANELCQLLDSTLKYNHQLRKALKGKLQADWLEALNDIQDQLKHLLYPGFLDELTPYQLRQYPRYLKGMLKRLEKMKQDTRRDRELRLQIQPLWDRYKTQQEKSGFTPALVEFRWMLEEFRVSLFAQDLGTAHPVSAKRLEQAWRDYTF